MGTQLPGYGPRILGGVLLFITTAKGFPTQYEIQPLISDPGLFYKKL